MSFSEYIRSAMTGQITEMTLNLSASFRAKLWNISDVSRYP
jgi:hypothetical protein